MRTLADFRTFFRQIEKRVVYCILIIFVAFQWVNVFLPQCRDLLGKEVNTALFSTLLLAIFRLFDIGLEQPGLKLHDHFNAAIDSILRTNVVIDSLDIFAHTSNKYYNAIRDKNIHIKHLRVLIIGENALPHTLTPDDPSKKERLKQEIDHIVQRWIDSKGENRIDNLEVHKYNYPNYFHFMIVNGKSAQFGIFHLINHSSGVTTKENYMYTLYEHYTVGRSFITDLKSYFNDIFDNYSDPVDISQYSSSGGNK